MARRTYHATGNKTTQPRQWPRTGSFEDECQLPGAGCYRCAVNRIASWIDQPRGDENEQIGLVSLGGLALEQASDQRNVAKERNFIVNLLELLGDQSPQDDRLTVPY